MKDKHLLFNTTIHEWAKLSKDGFLSRVENVQYLRATGFVRPYWFETAEDFHGLRELYALVNQGDFKLSTQPRHKLYAMELDSDSYSWLTNSELGTIQRQIVAWMAGVYIYNLGLYPRIDEIIYPPVLEQIKELHRQYYPEGLVKDYWAYFGVSDDADDENHEEAEEQGHREVPQDDKKSYHASCLGFAGCPPAKLLGDPFDGDSFGILIPSGVLHCASAHGRTGYFNADDWASIVIADVKKAQKFYVQEYGECPYDASRLAKWIEAGKTDKLARAEGDKDMMTKWRHVYAKPTSQGAEAYSLFDGEASHGYVYLIRNGQFSQYKIGWTKLRSEEDPEKSVAKRKAGNQTGNPEPLIVVGHFRASSVKVEKRLHKMFADRKGLGEWFDLTDMDVANILNPDWRSGQSIY